MCRVAILITYSIVFDLATEKWDILFSIYIPIKIVLYKGLSIRGNGNPFMKGLANLYVSSAKLTLGRDLYLSIMNLSESLRDWYKHP